MMQMSLSWEYVLAIYTITTRPYSIHRISHTAKTNGRRHTEYLL